MMAVVAAVTQKTLRQGYKNVSLSKSKYFDGVGAPGACHSLRSQTLKTCGLDSASAGHWIMKYM